MMTTRELAEILLSYPEGTEVITPDTDEGGHEPLVSRVGGKVLVY